MKRFTPIITFFAGCGFMLLISAKNQSTPAVEIPRYHISWAASTGIVYDAVTGKSKEVKFNEIKNIKSIKELLEK